MRRVDVGAVLSEYTLHDDRYFIKAWSEKVQSENTLPIEIQSGKHVRTNSRRVESFIAQDTSRLDALLRLGQQYRIPLGIEYVDREAITTKIRIAARDGTVATVLDRILPRSRGYYWHEEEGVIVVSHRKVPRGSKNLFNTRIGKFQSQAATIQELSNLLRMELELSLSPSIGGFAGSFAAGPVQTKIPPLNVQNKTVRDILNLVISQAQGAAWIVQAPPEQLGALRSRSLWGIVTYDSPPKPLAELCCLRLDAFLAKQKRGSPAPPVKP